MGLKFSIIMQSYLGHYQNAAKDRETKLIRAIDSVLNQSYVNYELIIVSDNCQKTIDIVLNHYKGTDFEHLKLFKPKKENKRQLWNTTCRNIGIEQATGDYCLYLDIDDKLNYTYLEELNDEIIKTKADWYLADERVFAVNRFIIRRSNLKMFCCGTANIIHKSTMKARWLKNCKYGSEDWFFIQQLYAECNKWRHLDVAGYYICHIPNKYDI